MQASRADSSVVPGTLGVTVGPDSAGVVITAVRSAGPAARADLRVGDVIVRFDGRKISSERQFERLVLDSTPGSRARVDIMRAGGIRSLDVLVEELATAPRV